MKNLLKMYGYISHLRNQLLLLTLAATLMAAMTAAIPYAFKLIIDEIVAHATNTVTNQDIIWYALGGLLVLRIATSVANFAMNLYSSNVEHIMVRDLRDRIFKKLTTLSIDYFESNKTGEIMQRASGNIFELVFWFNNATSSILSQTLTMFFALGLITITDWRAGALVIASTILFFVMQVPVLKRTRPIAKENRKVYEQAAGFLQETISHIGTVRSFGGEQGAAHRHYEALSLWRTLANKRMWIMQRSILSRQMITAVSTIGALGFIIDGILRGTHTAGDILLVSLYIQQVSGNVWAVGQFAIQTNDADVTAERVIEMLETKPTIIDAPDAKTLTSLKSVEFKNVSFTYQGKDEPALTNVSFVLSDGRTTALVGHSGSGKTTITKLLLRFYEPGSGEILVNGSDIREFTQESVRSHMGAVMQDVALFNDTVTNNLLLAKPKATKAAVRKAAEQAHASGFIEKLGDKYDTIVGERGVKLSGGEKQRVAIARAILKDPQLIILDEATSALDSESEAQVQAGLAELRKGRTSIVIAHRLSTIMAADQILVMDKGAIAEVGTHETLVTKRGGIYAKLFKLQTKGFIEG